MAVVGEEGTTGLFQYRIDLLSVVPCDFNFFFFPNYKNPKLNNFIAQEEGVARVILLHIVCTISNARRDQEICKIMKPTL